MTGAEKRAFRRLRGAERARCCAIVRELHRDDLRGVEPAELARYRETTYRDLRRIVRERGGEVSTMSDRDVIAWARQYGAISAMMGDDDGGKLRRLADLAEKGAEDWQPIASAPESTLRATKDRYLLFLSRNGQQFVGYRWKGDTLRDGMIRDATHWRPLPAPPGGER